jgi:hypothetical protein
MWVDSDSADNGIFAADPAEGLYLWNANDAEACQRHLALLEARSVISARTAGTGQSTEWSDDDLMSASKMNMNIALGLMTVALIVSLAILITALRGGMDVLRVSLAGVGFASFAFLYAAVLRQKLISNKSQARSEW